MPIGAQDIVTAQQLRAWADAGTILDCFTATESIKVRIKILDVFEKPELLQYELEAVEAFPTAAGAAPVFGGAGGIGITGGVERTVMSLLTATLSLGPFLVARTVLSTTPFLVVGQIGDVQSRTIIAAPTVDQGVVDVYIQALAGNATFASTTIAAVIS